MRSALIGYGTHTIRCRDRKTIHRLDRDMATKTAVRTRGWTLTADKLPPVGKSVLIQSFSSSGVVMEVAKRKRPFYDRGKMQRNRWVDTTGHDVCYYVEYWRPLPAAADCPTE